MEANIRPATRDDISFIATNMRAADAAEVTAARGNVSLDMTIYMASEMSDSCQVWCDDADTPLAIFGFAPLHHKPGVGVPWLLGTEKLKMRARTYVREARRVVAEMLQGPYPYLFNYVHVDNADSKKFLRAVGFKLHPPAPYGVRGELFHMFDAGDKSVYINGPGCGTLLTDGNLEAVHV